MPFLGIARPLLIALTACASLSTASAADLVPGVWTNITPPVTLVGTPGGVMCMAFDPSNTTTLYVGIDAHVGGPFTSGKGIWKSTDGGATWVQLGAHDADPTDNVSTWIDNPINIAVNPADSNHLYAVEGLGRNNGFWISRNGGNSWTRTYSYDLTTLAVNPTDFDHVLLSSHSTDFIGVLESRNGGVTWTLHPSQPGSTSGGTHALGFLYDPASGQGDANTWILHGETSGIWRTTNAGASWSKVSNSTMVHGTTDGGGTYYAKDGALYKAAHPHPLRSRNNGATWETLTQGVPNSGYNTVGGDGDWIYLGPDYPAAGWGVIFSPETNGTTWAQHPSPTLPTRGALQMRFDPVRRIMYSANWSSGLWALKVPNPSVPGSTAPTVATAASATPSSVTGTSTALSVRGVDDGGEAALTYTWSTVGTPPAPVVFSPNGRYAARNATVTFRKAGTYTLRASIHDAGRQTVTSDVTITVVPTASSIAVIPTTMVVVPNETRSFSASVRDQFGYALTSQPAVTWAVSGGGSIAGGNFTAGATSGGPFTITATSGPASGAANVSVSTTGDGLLGEYYDNDDLTAPTVTRIDPQVDFNWGYGTYDPSVGPGSNDTFTVRWTGRVRPPVTGTYTFTTITDDGVRLWVNGTQIINQWNGVGTYNGTIALNADQMYDLRMEFREVGGGASARLLWSASGLAQQVIPQARLFSAAPSSPVTPPGDTTPPTVATPASANPNPVTGTTAALSVLGADNNGEAALTYTWATVGTPPGNVTFSTNGSNAAKATTATFSAVGSHQLRVTIRDAAGLTTTSTVTVTVNQTTSSLSVMPATVTLASGATQAFSASVRDQFNAALVSQPAITWTATGNGTITSGGVFTAGAVGSATVTATGGGRSGSATITVSAATTPGNGTGLTGTYFDNQDFTGTSVVRQDPTVDFTWNGSPVSGIAATTFSVRWRGQVEAAHTQTYTFFTTSDDGVRLRIDGQTLIDQWNDHGPTEHSGTIALTAGTRYDVELDFYQAGGGARIALAWSSPSTAKATIPADRMFPATVTPPTAWTAQDLGSGTLAGSSQVNGDTITITGAGRDIWDIADGGRLLAQPLTGDGTITARVVSLTNTHAWAKAGVMIRESTASGARHAFCCVTAGNGVAFQRRTATDAASAHTGGSFTSAPRWVRLVRSGTTITGYESANGSAWTIVGSTTVGLGNPVQIGLAVTSHDNGRLCTAVFEAVQITPAGNG